MDAPAQDATARNVLGQGVARLALCRQALGVSSGYADKLTRIPHDGQRIGIVQGL
jgi:hypothetical protein